jgi:hypothetical protein
MSDFEWIPLRSLDDFSVPDERVLELAFMHGRVLLSHDVRTLYPLALGMAAQGLPIPRTVIAPRSLGYRQIIEQLELLLLAGTDADWGLGVVRLPV